MECDLHPHNRKTPHEPACSNRSTLHACDREPDALGAVLAGITKKCGKEVLKNETSATMNGRGVCPTIRAGFDSLRWTSQWRPRSRNPA
jgi:hypothetical protein